MKYTTEQIATLLTNITPGKWFIAPYRSDYGFDIETDQPRTDLRGDRGMMLANGADASFIVAAPAIVKQQAERIKELETALKRIANLPSVDQDECGWMAREALEGDDDTMTGEEIETVIARYECAFGMTSDEFLRERLAGNVPDTYEAMDWAMLLKYR